MSEEVGHELEHLFRRQAGAITARLARAFGPGRLDLAESVVQEALIRAMRTWPIDGIPDSPAGWIARVARNFAVDALRREKFEADDPEVLESLPAEPAAEPGFEGELRDDRLRLLFVCCHPLIPREARVALALKAVCGFGTDEIARAFLSREETIAQRIVRAKRLVRERRIPFEVPGPSELGERLDAVLDVVYLLFNEGYSATLGEELIRRDLCDEAIRLAEALAAHPRCCLPRVHALAALLLLQGSRFDARVDADGEAVLLEDQDRSRWDSARLDHGFRHLELAASGRELSEYHLQAGIAACHAVAPSFAETDWVAIREHYDLLMERAPSPVIAINRAVAIGFSEGFEAGLRALDAEPALRDLKGYLPLPAARADLHRRLGDRTEALEHYREALALAGNDVERRFFRKRIDECGGSREAALRAAVGLTARPIPRRSSSAKARGRATAP